MPEAQEHNRRLRWLLLGTFGGMLLLMGVAGVDALRSLRRLHQISREVTQRYSAHDQALHTVLVSFHVYDEEMEEYLLADVTVMTTPGPEEVASQGSEVHDALRKYPRDSGNEEDALVQQMDQAVKGEERAFDEAQGWHTGERRYRAQILLEEKIIPTRTHMLALANAVARLNDQRMVAETEAIASEFLDLQRRLSWMVATALLAGLLLSLVAGYYILRLEQNGRRRYLALERSRQELESLSRRFLEVQEAERLAISRELHDEVGQSLGAVLVDLGQLSNLVPAEDTLVKEQIARIKTAAESAVRSIRDMALLLRPPMLDDLGLIPALEWQAREISRRSDMEVEVRADEMSGRLPDQVRIGVYRLAQEALQNAATHADAKNARVSVQYDPKKVEVEISDDGVGFQPERTRGMGILGMEERVRQLGGTFEVQSSPGKGTTVRAVLPIGGKDSTEA